MIEVVATPGKLQFSPEGKLMLVLPNDIVRDVKFAVTRLLNEFADWPREFVGVVPPTSVIANVPLLLAMTSHGVSGPYR
jgi:hypothetical protein